MFHKRNLLFIYIKLFITSVFFFGLVNILIILVEKLSNTIFNTAFVINYESVSLSNLLPFALIFALLMTSSSSYITQGVRIEDKEAELAKIKEVLHKMKWKMKMENKDKLVFKSPFRLGLFMDEITVTFIDEEVQINGPREYVEKVISQGNYVYTSYKITNLNQKG
jgi:hypothetical protein